MYVEKYCEIYSNCNAKVKKVSEEYIVTFCQKVTALENVWDEDRYLTNKENSNNTIQAALRTSHKEDAVPRGASNITKQIPNMRKFQYIRSTEDCIFEIIGDKKF